MEVNAEQMAQIEKVAAYLDKGAAKVRGVVPGWIRWAIIAGIALFAVLGLWAGWSMVFGSHVEAAKHAESLHHALMRFVVALVVSLGATAGALFVLTILLDPLTCRREFLAKVKEGKASDLSMAIFSIGTALFAGAIFLATFDALSIS